MVAVGKRTAAIRTIRVVSATTYRRNRRLITIGRIPRRLRKFFHAVRDRFTTPAFGHLWSLVPAITVAQVSTIGRLVKLLRDSTHRTNHGEFLWRSRWNASAVMERIALDLLRSL